MGAKEHGQQYHQEEPGGHATAVHPLHAAGLGQASPAPVPAPFPRRSDDVGPPSWAVGLNDGSPLPRRSPYDWSLVVDTVIGYGVEGLDPVVHARVFEAAPRGDDGGDGGGPDQSPPPVVILSQFADHVGRPITQSAPIELAAAAAQARFYPDGRVMRVVLGVPHAHFYVNTPAAPLLLREVSFNRRKRQSGPARWWQKRRLRLAARDGRSGFAVTELTPDGVTRHVLSELPTLLEDWTFTGCTFGRDLALEVPDAHRDAIDGDYREQRWTRPAAVRVPALLGETELRTWPTHQYTAEHLAGPDTRAYATARYAAVRRRTNAEMGMANAIADPAPDGRIGQLGPIRLDPPDRSYDEPER